MNNWDSPPNPSTPASHRALNTITRTCQQSDADCVSGVIDGNGGNIKQSVPGGFIITATASYQGTSGGGAPYKVGPISRNVTIMPPVFAGVRGGGVATNYGNPSTPPDAGSKNNQPGCTLAFVFMSNSKNIGPAFYPQAAESITNPTLHGQAIADTTFNNPPAKTDARFDFGQDQSGYSAIFDFKWYGSPVGTGGLTYTGKFDDYVQANQLTWSTLCGTSQSVVTAGIHTISSRTHNPDQWNATNS